MSRPEIASIALPLRPQDMGARHMAYHSDSISRGALVEISAQKLPALGHGALGAHPDASGMAQLTDFGCASFAPQFTPDGSHIIFASNGKNCDSREFDLFRMRADGSDLRQVTDFGGFASFAEFSPDGSRVALGSLPNATRDHATSSRST